MAEHSHLVFSFVMSAEKSHPCGLTNERPLRRDPDIRTHRFRMSLFAAALSSCVIGAAYCLWHS